MSDCVFCSIINDDIPSHKVYEDENVVAFLDANPVSKGHTLVVPKTHVDNIHDASEMQYMWDALVEVSNALEKACDPEGINIAQNNGEAAGQEVFHLHFHVTPIYEGDELEIEYDRSELEDGESIAAAVKDNIA
ncbi:HIT family protein [Candidatus Nanosalina sp. VS9-1]|uniref:HIT family protein n=1 Tax=Candidatus Nanosalina sp. VS9-1 TaxID=3388566 RepID=UPI0039DF573D